MSTEQTLTKSYGLQCLVMRGVCHIFLGLSVAVTNLLLPHTVVVVSISALAFFFLVADLARLQFPLLNYWFVKILQPFLRDQEVSRLTGATYALVGLSVVLLIFSRQIATLAICFWAVGDVTSGGIRRLSVTTSSAIKLSLSSLACFSCCILVGVVIGIIDPGISGLVLIIGSSMATLIEALPLSIDDNLIMPLGAALAMSTVYF